jgi:diguanylate cyclase (GGDEF)-like protein
LHPLGLGAEIFLQKAGVATVTTRSKQDEYLALGAGMMPKARSLRQWQNQVGKINHALKAFIHDSLELGIYSPEWNGLAEVFGKVSCRTINHCRKKCPVDCAKDYRCWLQVGTMCTQEPSGDFQTKYKSCLQCKVFRELTKDPLHELYENINIIIRHLNERAAQLRDLAVRDPLTRLYNRHFFNEVIEREISRAERTREYLSFIMIDVDHLKQINDTWGHDQGDKMLAAVAQVLLSQSRASDILFRFGGDEFMFFLTNADRNKSQKLVQRIQEAVKAWNLKHAAQFGDCMALSLGVASGRPSDGLKLLTQADRNMYIQKRRNHRRPVMPPCRASQDLRSQTTLSSGR